MESHFTPPILNLINTKLLIFHTPEDIPLLFSHYPNQPELSTVFHLPPDLATTIRHTTGHVSHPYGETVTKTFLKTMQ